MFRGIGNLLKFKHTRAIPNLTDLAKRTQQIWYLIKSFPTRFVILAFIFEINDQMFVF